MGISIDEKRVYDASEGPTPVYVVGEFGVARVDTSDDLVGEFGLVHECSARDAAGENGRIAVATDEDVLVGVAGETETEFEGLGVGPAVAVGFAGRSESAEADQLLVARENGTILRGDVFGSEATEGSSREQRECDGGESWTELGDLADVRAIDGDFVAAASGVYHATGIAQSATKSADGSASSAGLQHVGLEDARDVSAAGVPLAATGDGLYRLGNGWMDELDGTFRAVSAAHAPADAGAGAGADAGALDGAHAAGEPVGESAGDSTLFAHEDGEWREVAMPVSGDVVAIDHGASERGKENENASRGVYAVTDDGTFLLSVGDGWNHQILGLRGATAVAAP
jgi:hypothetical protein